MRARHFQVLLLPAVTELTYSCENHVQEMQLFKSMGKYSIVVYKKNYSVISGCSFSTVWINIGAVKFQRCLHVEVVFP